MNATNTRPLSSLCDFYNGHGFTPRDWAKSGLPIIRIQNLNGSTEFNYFDGRPDPEWIIEPGTLLFSWAGTRGVSFGACEWTGPKGVLNQHILRVVPKPGVDKNWLFYALKLVTERVERKAHGFKSSLVHVRRADITEQLVETPSLETQRKIAKALRACSRRVHLAKEYLEALGQRRRGLVHALLSRTRRISGFSGKWRRAALREFLTESRTPGNDGSSAKKLTVRLYGLGVVAKQERLAGSRNTKYFTRRAGQFIFSKLDFLNGAFGIIPQDLDGYESTLDLPCFDIRGEVDPYYLVTLCTQEWFHGRFRSQAKGGRKARRVSAEEFLTSEISLPSPEEQQAIVSLIRKLDREALLTEGLARACSLEESGLVQQLLGARASRGVRILREATP